MDTNKPSSKRIPENSNGTNWSQTGKNGFEKDKTPEGTPDTPDNPDEYKTHITDAFDTLWLGMNFYFTLPGTHAGGIFFLNNK